jgi:ATP-binding cassette subfamily B multidrug efflux pump
MAGKTVIAIAHRLSTIAADGSPRRSSTRAPASFEQGSHRDLLAQNGHYAALWRRQAGGFIDAPAMQAAE